jgi:hypothetical protein
MAWPGAWWRGTDPSPTCSLLGIGERGNLRGRVPLSQGGRVPLQHLRKNLRKCIVAPLTSFPQLQVARCPQFTRSKQWLS